jgi:phenylpropionate dioxygenase-like ring-hydroxylating dioxygenase large terminal subunit
VFHNRCPHRGAQLCTLEQGQAGSITCPYHGWNFSLAGQLVAVPLPDEYPETFKLADHGLKPVARVANYRGFIFANLDPAAPDLVKFLGAAKTTIDNIVDRAPDDAVEAAPTMVRHRYRGNWKLSFENLNDTVHAAVAHAASVKAARKVSATLDDPTSHQQLLMMIANGKPQNFFQNLELMTEENGHSFMGGHMSMPYKGAAGEAYVRALTAARGKAEAERILAVDRHLTLIYPSSTWHARFQTVRFVRPLAPDLTEVIGIAFKLKGAPPEIHEEAIEYCTAATSPHSTIITDDLEIYETIQRTSRAAPAWLPISRGLDPRAGRRGANIDAGTSEIYIRNQYRRWSAALAA